MTRGKIRSESHLIDQDAIAIIKKKLPREWVVRELTPDYGIDLDVELFEKEDGEIVTLGERFYVQVKGTTNANYKDVKIDVEGQVMEKKCISFSIDTALLKLVERVGDSLPILLSVVDVNADEVYCISLNDYVNFVLCDDETWKMQKSKTVYLPCENKIEFALKYRESDVWNCERFGFCFLDRVHELIEVVANGKECASARSLFASFSEEAHISSGQYENMPLATAKQLYTCRRLIEELGTANCIFMSCIRQLFTITRYEAMISM